MGCGAADPHADQFGVRAEAEPSAAEDAGAENESSYGAGRLGCLGNAARGDTPEPKAMIDAGDGLVAGGEEYGFSAAPEGVLDEQVYYGGADAAPPVGGEGSDADDLAHARDGLVGAGGDGSFGGARHNHHGVSTAQTVAPVGELGGCSRGGFGSEGFESGVAGVRPVRGESD